MKLCADTERLTGMVDAVWLQPVNSWDVWPGVTCWLPADFASRCAGTGPGNRMVRTLASVTGICPGLAFSGPGLPQIPVPNPGESR